ncbi:MAG TPA: hypothetical protein VFA23_08520 [Dongiaceae bacterium]|nr:hypothetical protein [Dongiaceae bacterium]
MSDHIAYSAARHPAPHRARVGPGAIAYGLFAAPIMWAGNFMVDYALLSHACYPADRPLAGGQGGPGYLWWLTLAFHGLTLLVCVSGFLVSLRNWKRTGREQEGHAHHLMEAGEGRTRYFGVIGMSFAVLFFIAAGVSMMIYAFEPLCPH